MNYGITDCTFPGWCSPLLHSDCVENSQSLIRTELTEDLHKNGLTFTDFFAQNNLEVVNKTKLNQARQHNSFEDRLNVD